MLAVHKYALAVVLEGLAVLVPAAIPHRTRKTLYVALSQGPDVHVFL
jgi:hypothetical protein